MPRGVYERKHKPVPTAEPVVEQPKKKDEPTPEEIKAANAKARSVNEAHNQTRLEMLNEIADGADEHRDDDYQAKEESGQAGVEDEIPLQPDEEQALAEEEARSLQTEGVDQPPAEETPKLRKIIVNGRDMWLTEEQILERAQKVESADEYLRISAENARKSSELALSTKDVPVSLEKDQVRALIARAAMGDEEAADQLASVIARPSLPDISQQIDQRVSFRTELASLESEQREILNDPDLGDLFRARLATLTRTAPQTPLRDAYQSIGASIRKAFPDRFKKPGAAVLQDKATRKRSLPAPVQSAGRQEPEAEEDEELSASQVIDQMARSRHQPGAMVHGGELVTRKR